MEKERLILFTGHFGSGKTEISINYAIKAARAGEKVVLVDLDIVNPFFRSSEVKERLEAEGVKLISPNYALTTVDVPSLPAAIYSVFFDKSSRIIFDVGGDEVGARALGQFLPYFKTEAYRMFYVINTKRPLSSTFDDISEMLKAVEQTSRLRITDLINNTNLSYDTQVCDIIEGHSLVKEVSQALGLPITYVSGTEELLDNLPEGFESNRFPLDIYMKPIWGQQD